MERQSLTERQLFLAPCPLGGAIEIAPHELSALQAPCLRQLPQCIFYRHMQHGFQFINKTASRGVAYNAPPPAER